MNGAARDYPNAQEFRNAAIQYRLRQHAEALWDNLALSMSNVVHPSTIHGQHLCRDPA